MPRLSLRIDLPKGRIGPGKIALLEAVAETGSISGAARAISMSYRRAWMLVDDVNALFEGPLVTTQAGGRSGGGAALTQQGRDVVRLYRAVESKAAAAVAADLDILRSAGAKPAEAIQAARDPGRA